MKRQLHKNFSPTTPLSGKFFDIVGRSRARFNHDFKLRPKIVHTNYFKYSFFNRYISDWNFLPGDVVNSPSLQSFKTSSLKFLRSVNRVLLYIVLVSLYFMSGQVLLN